MFTGIGNPDAFVMTCEALNMKIVDKAFFPDHHHFTPAEVAEVWERAIHWNAAVVTTVKDLVKIAKPPERFFALDIQAEFSDADEQAAFEAGLLK